MAIRTAPPPSGARESVGRALADLGGTAGGGGRKGLIGDAGGTVEAAEAALPVYALTLEALGGRDPLGAARLVAWRYMVRQGGRHAMADARAEGDGAAFARLSHGPAADALMAAAARAEQLAGDADCEARVLEVPALKFAAIWLHGGADLGDRFLGFGPEGPDGRLRTTRALLALLRARAKALPETPAPGGGGEAAARPAVATPVGGRGRTKRAAPVGEGPSGDRPAGAPPRPARPRAIATAHSRTLTILAQDPGVRLGPERALSFARVEVPAEELALGPTGYRVKVVDYDASAECLYVAETYYDDGRGGYVDPFARGAGEDRATHEARLLANPNFHAQNVYAIVMRTLARFERALGRRVSWGFDGHQLHVAPHAFCEANAFYSREDEALFFGYFRGASGEVVHTCLSHDVVAHETTHALLDGLRNRFTDLSLPDQAALHEGFADVVALLSMFSLEAVVAAALGETAAVEVHGRTIRTIAAERVEEDALKHSILFGLADQVGRELDVVHGDALRRSVEIAADAHLLDDPRYAEAHMRGEIFVAAVMQAFLKLWRLRIEGLGTFPGDGYNLDMVIAEGAKVGDHLLTMCIRALDYCPPTDIDFGAYLAALLTADAELVPDDSRFTYRATIRDSFRAFGIDVPKADCDAESGTWLPFDPDISISYARSNFESMLRDRDEVFRFIWDNRVALGISERNHIEVASVRPSQRIGPDGFALRETVCEYVETVECFGSEITDALGVKRRRHDIPTTERVTAYGGGAIVFDQYGRIKYQIVHRLTDSERQRKRIDHLYGGGMPQEALSARERLTRIHRLRGLAAQGERRAREGGDG